jgi:hypothetical protein
MYVAIIKKVKDLDVVPEWHKNSHPEYPLDVVEFPTKAAAMEAHPTAEIISVEEYNGFKRAMNLQHGKIMMDDGRKRKPWYQFWK